MKTIKLSYPHTLSELPKTVAAIGFFDGIHQGHQQVIKEAVQSAQEMSAESAVITFHPHPSVVLNNTEKHVKYITPMEVKEKILADLQVDRLYVIHFNKQLSQLSPQEFIDHFIVQLNIKHLVAGFDYSYGYKGEGNMDNIKDYAKSRFTYSAVNKVELNNEKVSSTEIRRNLTKGEIREVSNLLGRNLALSGTVIKGDQRGRTIGYPTANLELQADYLLPKTGVYAVTVDYHEKTYFGMANLGVRPTFVDDAVTPTLEVHILDFDKDIYGEKLIIKWHQFIREEKKFASVEAIINQLNQDEKSIRNYFNDYKA